MEESIQARLQQHNTESLSKMLDLWGEHLDVFGVEKEEKEEEPKKGKGKEVLRYWHGEPDFFDPE
jgi:hypothetical protein